MSENRYFIINKPYNMVSQFVSSHKVNLLGDLDFEFPEGTHAIGRLDNCSEGLLILTTNKKVTRLLFNGEQSHKRTYLVQVSKIVSEERVQQLRNGIAISAKGGGEFITTPCDVTLTERPVDLPFGRHELRPDLPQTWMYITLTEGKYRQIRKMVGAIHHQCKRLIRVSIEDLTLGTLPSGAIREFDEETFFNLLKIYNWRVEQAPTS